MNHNWLVKTAVSVAALGVFVVLAAGSIEPDEAAEVSVDTIARAKAAFTQAMEQVKVSATETSTTVTSAYDELKRYLDQNNLNDPQLRQLEQQLDIMKTRRDTLNRDLEESKEEAGELFTLLKNRAEENETEELRERLLDDIETKRQALQARFDAANEQMEKVDASIQKYDDIVGYLQVHRGLEGIDQITEDIDQFIAAGAQFDEEIHKQIEEGMQLVEGL